MGRHTDGDDRRDESFRERTEGLPGQALGTVEKGKPEWRYRAEVS